MSFKEVIYRNYVQNHTHGLYGAETLDDIRRNIPAWRYYFGRLLPQSRDAAVLDIGCGKGSFVWFLQQEGFAGASGIDVSEEQIEYGQTLGIRNIECADLNVYLASRKEAYDCIIARDVMEHFSRQELFDILALLRSALKPGGSFIMQSPNGEGIFFTAILYGDLTHEIAFTRSSLHQLFRNTGFDKVQCIPVGPAPTGLTSAIRWLLWQLIVLKMRFYKIVETGDSSGIFTRNLIAKAIRD